MATTYAAKGTSFGSFTIGKQGATLYQGTAAPDSGVGKDGDLYVRRGSVAELWQRSSGVWEQIGSLSEKIVTDTTEVTTGATPNTITFVINGTPMMELTEGSAQEGETLVIQADETFMTFLTSDDSGTNGVGIQFELQGNGVFRISSETPSAITSPDGSTISMNPSTVTETPGDLILGGGSTTQLSTSGGNVVLNPGTGPSGLGQILAHEDYVPSEPNSLMTRSEVEALINAALNP